MNMHSILRPEVIFAAVLILCPMLFAGFVPERSVAWVNSLPRTVRLISPSFLCVPYTLVAHAFESFRLGWFALYALLPVGVALLLDQARNADAVRRSNWRDFIILAVLGLAVDLRWFEPAWPDGLAAFGKMLLLDAGIYGFLAVRQLDGVGFDLRLRGRDAAFGLREFVLYAVLAIPLGLGLGFLHFHPGWPQPLRAVEAFVFTLLFIAIPEELFFRGWLQNLLERRIGRTAALVLTAILFGLAHWNKRTTSFNWQYVLMAAIAGIFYGRAWRAQRRVGASALTHATVDTLWSLWLR
ncbi:MAG: type II CAAX prenyl endopeptidase Rce1 family protein [Terracidiphilus sp.]